MRQTKRLPRIPETEKGFLQAIRELARALNYLEYHTFSSINSPHGFPDLVLMKPPRLLVVEVKTEKGRLTPAQRMWLDAFRGCPAVEVFVWRPSDWRALVEVLKE